MSRRLRRRTQSALFALACTLATIVALGALGAVVATVVDNGIGAFGLALFTRDQPPPGAAGGLRNAIVGSLVMCTLGMALALTLGVLAGTWLAEYGRGTRRAAAVRFLNDVMISAPAILVGLFVYELLVVPFHGFSALAGAVALGMLAAPIVARTTEEMLALQPDALREAGLALGAGRARTVARILWRAARGGLATAGLLAFARIAGETAPLLFTSLGSLDLNATQLTQPMASLPTTMFQFALSAYDDWRRLAWAAALLILLGVLAVSILARAVARGAEQP